MSLYQRKNDFYYIDYYTDGKRHQISTHTKNLKVAETILKTVEGRIILNRFDIPVKRKILLKDFAEEYLEYSESNKARGTYEIERYALRMLESIIGNKVISSFTVADIETYKSKRNVAKTTINIELRSLKSIFSIAMKWNYINKNVFREVKQFRIKETDTIKFLSKEEIIKLLNIIEDNKFKNFVQCLLYTGARRNEVLFITWQHIFLDNKTVTFVNTKSGKNRTVPINETLYKILLNMKNSNGSSERLFNFTPFYASHKFKKYLKLIGVEYNKSLHILRHTFASHLVMNGTDIYTVSKLLGHSSVEITKIYSHLAPDFLRASVEKLKFL